MRGYPYQVSKEQDKIDKDFMKLRDQVLKLIEQGADNQRVWRRFVKYMQVYYE